MKNKKNKNTLIGSITGLCLGGAAYILPVTNFSVTNERDLVVVTALSVAGSLFGAFLGFKLSS